MTESRYEDLFTSLRALRDSHAQHAGSLQETADALMALVALAARASPSLAGRLRALANRVGGHAFELSVGLEALSRIVDRELMEDTAVIPLGELGKQQAVDKTKGE